MLELREVTKRYPTGAELVVAVDGVSATIDAGELVALFGPSGSGKTTLLLLAAGIESPDAGVVLFDGMNLGGLSRREMVSYRRDKVGVVLQTPLLQPGLSAHDNAGVKLIAAGMTPRRARARTLPLLELVGLGDRLHHRPAQLSTGERQRVGLVQALANSPRLILADEPTGNLDSQRSDDVLGFRARACLEQGVAALLVTHDTQAARHATRVLPLKDGSIEHASPTATHARGA